MRIKIISKGTAQSTTVVDAGTGEIIHGVTSIEILPFSLGEPIVTARLEFEIPLLDIEAEVSDD